MAYPNISSWTKGNNGASTTTSTTITPPAGTMAGDLLLLFIAKDGTGPFAEPSGWDTLANYAGAAQAFGIFKKKLTEPLTATFTVAHAAEGTSWLCVRIPGGLVEIGTVRNTASTTTTVYPGNSLTHSFGAGKEVMWIGAAAWDYNRTVSGWPSNLTEYNFSSIGGSTGACGMAIATMKNTDATLDPSHFTISTADTYCGYMLCVALEDDVKGTWSVKDTEVMDGVHQMEWQSLTKVADGKYVAVYNGSGDDGFVRGIDVDSSDQITLGAEYEYQTTDIAANAVFRISDTRILVLNSSPATSLCEARLLEYNSGTSSYSTVVHTLTIFSYGLYMRACELRTGEIVVSAVNSSGQYTLVRVTVSGDVISKGTAINGSVTFEPSNMDIGYAGNDGTDDYVILAYKRSGTYAPAALLFSVTAAGVITAAAPFTSITTGVLFEGRACSHGLTFGRHLFVYYGVNITSTPLRGIVFTICGVDPDNVTEADRLVVERSLELGYAGPTEMVKDILYAVTLKDNIVAVIAHTSLPGGERTPLLRDTHIWVIDTTPGQDIKLLYDSTLSATTATVTAGTQRLFGITKISDTKVLVTYSTTATSTSAAVLEFNLPASGETATGNFLAFFM